MVGVSKVRTSGALQTKSGRRRYRGNKKHWYVYYYDDEGKFHRKRISSLQVPYYGSLIRRRKSYQCTECGTKFRAWGSKCPRCGSDSMTTSTGPGEPSTRGSLGPAVVPPSQVAAKSRT